jgi:hypothetical protein
MLWVSSAKKFAALTIWAVLVQSNFLSADSVPVRHMEGVVHGFLVVRTLEGQTIAAGELTQSPHGGRLTNHLVFHFKDGSIQDETVVFAERGTFLLLKYHLVQKGRTFP